MQNKSQVGGILSIISGVLGIIGFLGLVALILFFSFALSSPELGADSDADAALRMIQLIYGIMAAVLLVLGIIGIVGGVFAMKKRHWGLALAGAICGVLTFLPTGIIATIFVAQAQKEFSAPTPIDTGTS